MKKFLIAILSLAMLFGVVAGLAACQKTKTSEVLLCGFDSYDEVVKFNYKRSFGIVDLVTDEEYVTQGEMAAKITTIGDAKEGLEYKPYIVMYTDSPYINRKNFLDVEMFKIDVYNTHDTDKTFALSLNTQSEAMKGEGSPMDVVVRPGMNHVEIPLNRNFLSQLMALDNVVEILFTFPNQTTDDERATLYFDNFRAVTTNAPIDTSAKIREENEIESADKSEYLSAWSLTSPLFSPVRLEFNSDPQYISQGTGSFKWTCLDVNENGGRGTTTPGFQMVKSILTDLSDYYSISFDIYNTQDKSYPLYTFSFLQIGTIEPGWNRFEFTIDEVAGWRDTGVMEQENFDPNTSHYKYDIENFQNFNLFTVDPQEYLVFYFDNFMANKETVRGPQPYVNAEPAVVAAGESFTIPAAQLPYGEADITWVVKDDAGNIVAENSPSAVTLAEAGVYTVEYTAVNEKGTGKTEYEIRVGVPAFTENFHNKIVAGGRYTLEPPAVSGEMTVSVRSRIFGLLFGDVQSDEKGGTAALWRTETVGTDNTITLENSRNYEITYSVTENGVENRYVQNLFVMDGYELVQDSYPDAFTGQYADVLYDAASSDLTITENAMRLVGLGQVKTFLGNENFYLSNNVEDFTFFLYNNSDELVYVDFFQDVKRALYPHTWTRFDYGLELYLRGWKVLQEDNLLNDLSLRFYGAADQEIDVIVDGFMVKNGPNEGPIILYDAAPVSGTAGSFYSFAEVDIRTNDGSAVHSALYAPDGTKIGDDLTSFTPEIGGTYRVVYTAENGWGTSTQEFEFVVSSDTTPVIRLNDVPFVQVVGETTFVVPDEEQISVSGGEGLTLSWEISSYSENGTVTAIGKDLDQFQMTDNDAFKIVYSAKNSKNEVTRETIWVLYNGGQRLFSEIYGKEILSADHLANFQLPTYGLNTDRRYIIDGDASIALPGAVSDAGFRYDLHAEVGNASFISFFVYATGGDVTLNISGGSGIRTIKGGQWNKVALPMSFYEAWGTVVDKGLESLLLHIGKYDGTLYFSGFGVSGNDAKPTVTAPAAASIERGSEYSLSAAATGLSSNTATSSLSYAIYAGSVAGEKLYEGSYEEGKEFLFEDPGKYLIVYTAENVFGEATAETVLTVTVPAELLPTIDLGDIPYNEYVSGTYTVARPETSGTLSWTVEKYADGQTETLEGQPETLSMIGVVQYKITYKAENEYGEATETIWVIYRDACEMLEDGTDEFTNMTKVNGTGVEENTDKRYVLSGEKSLKILPGANFTWNPELELGLSDMPIFYIYVDGADASLTLSGLGTFTLKGGEWNIVSYGVYFWDAWQNIDENVWSGLQMSLPADYTGALYLDGLGLHGLETAKPGLTVTANEMSATVGETVQIEATATGLSKLPTSVFTYKVMKDGAVVTEETACTGAVTLEAEEAGVYTVIFTATNRYGSTVQEVRVTVAVPAELLPTIDLGEIPYNEYVSGTYTVARPETSGTLSWTVEKYADGQTETLEGQPETLSMIGVVQYKITYKAENEYGEATETIWVIYRDACEMLEDGTDEFTNMTKVNGTGVEENTDKRYVLSGEKSLKILPGANFTWNPELELGLSDMPIFYIYVDGADASLTLSGLGTFTLKGGEWNIVSYGVYFWDAWQNIDENVWSGLQMSLPADYTGALYLDGLGLHGLETAKPGLTVTANEMSATVGETVQIEATATGLSKLPTSVFTYKVMKDGAVVTEETACTGAVTLEAEEAGVYTVIFTATNRYGSTVQEVRVTVAAEAAA